MNEDRNRSDVAGGPDSLLELGMAVRREVLGEEHVRAAGAATSAFDRDFQRFITEVAWGSVWARPGLEPERLAEALLHVAVYAGIPAAHSAFRLAKSVLEEDPAAGGGES